MLLIVATSFVYIGQMNNAEIQVAPFIGFIVGALYSYTHIEEEDVMQYTLQCCIGFISLTIVWEKNLNG